MFLLKGKNKHVLIKYLVHDCLKSTVDNYFCLFSWLAISNYIKENQTLFSAIHSQKQTSGKAVHWKVIWSSNIQVARHHHQHSLSQKQNWRGSQCGVHSRSVRCCRKYLWSCGSASQLKAKRSVTVINGACNHNLLPRHRITNISAIS